MRDIQTIRKAVAVMANELHKTGLTLSEAFKKAWRRVKESITLRVSGTTFDNRQNRLKYISGFRQDDIRVVLERESNNKYDASAIKVWVQILSIGKQAVVGYIPAAVSKEIAKVLDKGIKISASGRTIGGYTGRENYGFLLNMAF